MGFWIVFSRFIILIYFFSLQGSWTTAIFLHLAKSHRSAFHKSTGCDVIIHNYPVLWFLLLFIAGKHNTVENYSVNNFIKIDIATFEQHV